MHRRELIRSLTVVAALPFMPRSGEAALLFGESIHERALQGRFRTLTPEQQALVSQLVDRIIPTTDTPGALDVQVPEFVDLLLTEWYEESDRLRILSGLDAIDERARALGGTNFVDLSESQKQSLMQSLDSARTETSGPAATFAQLKSLTVYGYFTSERVSKDVLQKQIVFAEYDACALTITG